MKIIPVPVRSDNYAYLLVDETANKAAAVDPYDVPLVQAAAKREGLQIIAAIATHHHFDHSGGNHDFAKAFPGAPIYGGSKAVKAVTHLVKDKDTFTIGDSIHVSCLATPCHTQDSICYHVTSSSSNDTHPGGIFTGDTLFIAGCGRFFEGTSSEMISSLSYLSTLPNNTIVYNGHEYTKGNLAFAKSVDPENKEVVERLGGMVSENEVTTGLTTIGDEKDWNPFMRLGTDAIREATGKSTDSEVMERLREMKNNFSG